MSQSEYIAFLDEVKTDFEAFIVDATSGINNKTTSLNARKKSMVLREKLKDFRNKSISNDKSRTKKSVDGGGE